MDIFRKIFFRKHKPAALKSSILGSLPVDIIVYITNCLPLEAVVAFSLTCTNIQNLSGTRCYQELNSSPKERLALLHLLARDLPNQIACGPCTRLHSMKNVLKYNETMDAGPWRYNIPYPYPGCVEKDQRNRLSSTVSMLFGETAFKMVMKRHHQQEDCTEMLKQMSSQKAVTEFVHRYVRQSMEEVRLVRGHLMHRLRRVYISLKTSESSHASFRQNPPLDDICPHISVRASIRNNSSGIQFCGECRTEYRIDFKNYLGHGLAMFLSRWKDLGPGPESEVWTQHLRRFQTDIAELWVLAYGRRPPKRGPQAYPSSQTCAMISPWFEDSLDFEFDSLLTSTSSNKAELFRFQEPRWAMYT